MWQGRPRGLPQRLRIRLADVTWPALAIVLLVLPMLVLGTPAGWTEAAEEPGCLTSGPDTDAYLVELCITRPNDRAIVSGDVEVGLSITDIAGVSPPVVAVQWYFTRATRDQANTLLADFAQPYTFTLPTPRWTDDTYRLEVKARFMDGFVTDVAGIQVTTQNAVFDKPEVRNTWSPYGVEGAGPVVVAAVGDGGGGLPGSMDVAALVSEWDPDMLVYLGDVYETGSYTEFLNYYEPTLGDLRSITNPVPGDHEAMREFSGYHEYWDTTSHYYATSAGPWTLIGLDSTESFGQVQPGTSQFEWLRAQLVGANDDACTAIFLHQPRWSLRDPGGNALLQALWELMVDEGVDVVLAADEHNYQRWWPMNRDGEVAPSGLTQLVVGTGGHFQESFTLDDPRVVTRYRGDGALRLELHEGGALYQFVDTTHLVVDEGSITCREQGAELGAARELAQDPMVDRSGIGDTPGVRAATPGGDAVAPIPAMAAAGRRPVVASVWRGRRAPVLTPRPTRVRSQVERRRRQARRAASAPRRHTTSCRARCS